MYHKHHTEGIVLKAYDSGDSNKKIALLTRDLGLVYAHVQSGRSLSSKLRGSIQEFSLGSFSLIKGVSGWKAVGAHMEKNIFKELRGQQARLKIVNNIFNLFRGLVGEGEQALSLHAPLKGFIEQFSLVPEDHVKLAEYGLLFKVLHELGYISPSPGIESLLHNFNLAPDNLMTIEENKKEILASINQALAATHLKM